MVRIDTETEASQNQLYLRDIFFLIKISRFFGALGLESMQFFEIDWYSSVAPRCDIGRADYVQAEPVKSLMNV